MTETGARPKPAAEVVIDVDLVRRLLEEQHPDLAERPLRIVDEGWDNVIVRLGDDLVVRVPRRAIAAPFAEAEHRWLPELAPRLPLAVPEPIRIGRPGCGYPWSWSVCRWIEGRCAMDAPFADEHAAAASLGDFIAALHQEAPADAPFNPYRGIALGHRDAATRGRIDVLGRTIDRTTVTGLWDESIAVPLWERPPLWVHGDIHLGNLVVDDGRLVAVIDFGDLGAADPAPDLAPAWTLFGRDARETFRQHAPDYDEDTWRRGRGWALNFALMYLADCGDDVGFLAMGRHAMDAVLGEA